MIYADFRWIGPHGIGHFAENVLSGTPIRRLPLKSKPSAPFDPLYLAINLSKVEDVTLFYSPGYNAPLFSRTPFVFTIHDLNHIECPETISLEKRIYYSVLQKRACHRATYIITVSEFSKSRIIEWSGVSAEKVVNVGSGVDASFSPNVVPFDNGRPYFLCTSNRKPHKNEFRLVDAFVRADLPADVQLLFTGSATPQLLAHIQSRDALSRVSFTGFIPQPQLPSLYTGAIALAFPSLYEGFGLPVVEAMACGTPAISSNTTSIPEIAGDAAVLVDPLSVEEIALAIRNVFCDSNLRNELREKGFRQAALHSWSDTASKVNKVLSSIS